MNALGFNVWLIRFCACLFSGLLTAIAGILFVYYNEFISPQALALTASAEVVLMVISGGAGTLFGPVVGAARGDHEKCRQRLYRAMEFCAGGDLCRDRRVYAGRYRAGNGAIMALASAAARCIGAGRGGAAMSALAISNLEKVLRWLARHPWRSIWRSRPANGG